MTLHWTSGRRRGAIGAALVGLLSPLALTVPAWASSVANEVVYTADADNDGIYTVVLRNLETQQSTTLLPEDAVNEWTYDDPELSPDGSRVVLSTDRGSATSSEGIAVVNRDGSGFRRLTEPPRTATTESVDLGARGPRPATGCCSPASRAARQRDPAAVRTALHVVPAAGGAAVPYGQATTATRPTGARTAPASCSPRSPGLGALVGPTGGRGGLTPGANAGRPDRRFRGGGDRGRGGGVSPTWRG
jgi:hypothetical protein